MINRVIVFLVSVITIVAINNVQASQVAKDRAFPDRCWNGDIAEILLYNVPLADGDRQKVEQYMIGKYKIDTTVKPVVSQPAPAENQAKAGAAKGK